MKKDTIATATIPLKNIAFNIKPAQLKPDPESRLDTHEKKETPMSENSIPFRNDISLETKIKSIHTLIDILDVEHSTRYQKTIEDTYCNVYSYDYCYYNNIYLPTVWWTDESIEKLKNGEDVEAIFEDTVERIYSSAIHDWFGEWGANFGWEKMENLTQVQDKVNQEGGVGIICAKRREVGKSGHIVPVVPETHNHQAVRNNNEVIYPLQSQAGKENYKYFSEVRGAWWSDELYSSYVIYYHK